MKVALVNPIQSYECEMPLGLLYVADAADRAGHQVRIFDTGFSPNGEHLWPAMDAFGPDVVGFTAMSVAYPRALRFARESKRRYGAITVMGGPHASVFPHDLVLEDDIDAVVVGDGEIAFPGLLGVIAAEGHDAVPGVLHTLGGEVCDGGPSPRVNPLDDLPFPRRRRLDALDTYVESMGQAYFFGRRPLTIAASRGCPFDCSYCQPTLNLIHGKPVRVRSPGNVVDEMEHLRDEYGVDAIWFIDDTFTFDRRWVEAFCAETRRRGVELAWSCNSRVDTARSDILPIMAEAGCRQVRMGLESGAQIMLDGTLGKGITIAQTKEAFRNAREHGMMTWAYVMVGGFEETPETIRATVNLLDELHPDHIQITMTSPLPGTHFAAEAAGMPNACVLPHTYDELRLFDNCLIDTAYLPHQEVERAHRWLYADFSYFDPSSMKPADRRRWVRRKLGYLQELAHLTVSRSSLATLSHARLARHALSALAGSMPMADPVRLRLVTALRQWHRRFVDGRRPY